VRRLLFLALAVLMTLVVSLPAGADKPDCNTYPDGHPQACPSEDPPDDPIAEPPMGGTMCDPAEYPVSIDVIQTGDFSFSLGGKQAGTCIDVISGAGPWEVTITGGGAKYLGVIPRDSYAAGDSCGGYLLRSEGNIYGSNPLILGYTGVMPAATVNACGTDFGEWVDIALDGLEPSLVTDGGDCSVIDGDQCLVAGQLDVEHPLVLQAFLSGSADGVTNFYVDLWPLDPNWPPLPDGS
jgi:hypothetical protein